LTSVVKGTSFVKGSAGFIPKLYGRQIWLTGRYAPKMEKPGMIHIPGYFNKQIKKPYALPILNILVPQSGQTP